MSMTMRERLVRGYAFSIFLDGMRTFGMVAEEYHQEVKTYAALNIDEVRINAALETGKITQEEYDETMRIKYPA